MHAGSTHGQAEDYSSSSSGSSSDDDELPLAQKLLRRAGGLGVQRSSSPSDAAAAADSSSADSSRKRSASPRTAEQDQGSGESRRKREQKFKRISAKERCGRCHTCLNPQLRKACETVRQQQLLQQHQVAGGTKATATPTASKVIRNTASTPSTCTQPAAATGSAMPATTSQSFLVETLERIISAHHRGGVTDTRHMPALQHLLDSQTELGPRQVLLTVIKMSSDDVRTQIVKGPALKTLETWVVEASEGRDSCHDAAARATLMSDVIKCLAALPVDVEALRRTGIGRTFGRLPKTLKTEILGSHTAQVASACKNLVEQWKRLVEPDSSNVNGAQKRKESAASPHDSHAAKKLKPSVPTDGGVARGFATQAATSSTPPPATTLPSTAAQRGGQAPAASSAAQPVPQQPDTMVVDNPTPANTLHSTRPPAAAGAGVPTTSSAVKPHVGSLPSGQASNQPTRNPLGAGTASSAMESQSASGSTASPPSVAGSDAGAQMSASQPMQGSVQNDKPPETASTAPQGMHATDTQPRQPSLVAATSQPSLQLGPSQTQGVNDAGGETLQPADTAQPEGQEGHAKSGMDVDMQPDDVSQSRQQPPALLSQAEAQQHTAKAPVQGEHADMAPVAATDGFPTQGSVNGNSVTGPQVDAPTGQSTQASIAADSQQQEAGQTEQSAAGVGTAVDQASTVQPGAAAATAASTTSTTQSVAATALPRDSQAAASSTPAVGQQAAALARPAGASRPPGSRTGGLNLRLGAGSAGGESSRLGGLRSNGSPAMRLGSLRDRQGLPGSTSPAGSASSAAAAIASSEQRAAVMFGGVDAATAVAAMQPVVSFPGGRLSAAERAAQAAHNIDAALAADPELARRVPAGARVGKRKRVRWPDDDKDLQTVRWFRKDDPPCKAAQDAPVPKMAQMGAAGGVMIAHHAPGFERAARREHAGERAALAAQHQEEERERAATTERFKMMHASLPSWHRPPLLALDPKWEVAAGEDSAERHLMAVKATQRAPANYPTVNHVPPNPAEPPADGYGPPFDPHRAILTIPLQAVVAGTAASAATAATTQSTAAAHAPGQATSTPFAGPVPATAGLALPTAPAGSGRQVAMTSALSPELLSALGQTLGQALTAMPTPHPQQQQQAAAITTQGSELLANLGFLDRAGSQGSQPAVQPGTNAASAAAGAAGSNATGPAGTTGQAVAGQSLGGNANLLAMLSALTSAASKQTAGTPAAAPAQPPTQPAASSSTTAPASTSSANSLSTLSSLLASIGSQLGMANTSTAGPDAAAGQQPPAPGPNTMLHRPSAAQASTQAGYSSHSLPPPGPQGPAPGPPSGRGAPNSHPAAGAWPGHPATSHPAPPSGPRMVREREGAWEGGSEWGGEVPGWGGRGGGHRGRRGGTGLFGQGRGRGGAGDGEEWEGPGGAGGFQRGGGRGGRGGRSQRVCKFFNTPEGCKKGDTCDFLHVLDDGAGEVGMGNGGGRGAGHKARGGRGAH